MQIHANSAGDVGVGSVLGCPAQSNHSAHQFAFILPQFAFLIGLSCSPQLFTLAVLGCLKPVDGNPGLRAGRPVWVLPDSKGGTDALATLLGWHQKLVLTQSVLGIVFRMDKPLTFFFYCLFLVPHTKSQWRVDIAW